MSISTTPPPSPWGKGKGYTCVDLRIRVVENHHGWVFSEHDFATPEDASEAARMKQGGVKQIAYALTTEALRREAFLCLLASMTSKPKLLEWYSEGSMEYKESLRRDVSNTALATLMGIAQKMLPGVTEEVFEMAIQQSGGSETDTNG